MKLSGKVVVITGGASGIGAETARSFLNEGCNVAVFGRTSSKVENFIKRLNNEGYEVFADIAFCSLMPTAKNGIYSVAKAGVNALTTVLAAELAPLHIRVNTIIPGFIETDMTINQLETIEDMLIQPISMREFGKPEDIADGIVFLASDKARYINGHALIISGGKFLVQNPQDPWNNYVGGY